MFIALKCDVGTLRCINWNMIGYVNSNFIVASIQKHSVDGLERGYQLPLPGLQEP